MFLHSVTSLVLSLALFAGGVQVPPASPAVPEDFTATAQVTAAAGSIAATIKVRVDRYVVDYDRDAIRAGLKHGGYTGFLTALRAAPAIGSVSLGDQKFIVRWATQETIPSGRRIVVITDKPVAFVGGAAVGAKSRAGYEVAVIRFEIDKKGQGQGEMAAAARVRPGGDTGVLIDDYAEALIKLTKVTKGS